MNDNKSTRSGWKWKAKSIALWLMLFHNCFLFVCLFTNIVGQICNNSQQDHTVHSIYIYVATTVRLEC